MALTNQEVEALIGAALIVREQAYAPYSKYRVGAAVLSGDDRVYLGCNVENASYGISLCAERNAIAQAVAAGVSAFKAIVVVTSDANPGTPCGACRQWMAEFCSDDLQIILSNSSGKVVRYTLGQLFPHAFRLNKI